MTTFFLLTNQLGGAEQLMMEIAKFYLKNKKEVTVVFLIKDSVSIWDSLKGTNGFNMYYLNFSPIKLYRYLINYRHTLVITTHVHITGLTGLLRKLNLLKTEILIGRESTSIFMRYSGWKLFTYKIMYNLGYSKLDLLICQSQHMKQQLVKELPWLTNKTRIEIIDNPINLEDIKRNMEKPNFLIPLDFEYIVSAGRLIIEKGFDILIDAFYNISDQYPHLKLVILGDGILKNQLEQQINRLQMNKRIVLTGFVDNVYPYFRNAEACVVSSRIEGFPNVLLQMMSQNTNVVSTLCAGGIENIKGVYTSKTDDIRDLQNSLMLCIDSDNDEKREYFDYELNSRSIESFITKMTLFTQN